MSTYKNIHSGHRSRVRDRVRKEGLDNFQEYQVLEYALSFVLPYKDTNPIAHELINRFGSLSGVLEAEEDDLKAVNGMGEISAQYITSIIKIYNYYEQHHNYKELVINNPGEAVNYVKRLFAGRACEELYLISMRSNNKVVKVEKICEGNTTEAHVAVRKITDSIARNKATRIIIAHNHPRGIAEPSVYDDDLTKALIMTLTLNDCEILDHIIVGQHKIFSYRRTGKLDGFKNEFKGIMGIKHKKIAQSITQNGEQEYD